MQILEYEFAWNSAQVFKFLKQKLAFTSLLHGANINGCQKVPQKRRGKKKKKKNILQTL